VLFFAAAIFTPVQAVSRGFPVFYVPPSACFRYVCGMGLVCFLRTPGRIRRIGSAFARLAGFSDGGGSAVCNFISVFDVKYANGKTEMILFCAK
jgi:hypothetical protein